MIADAMWIKDYPTGWKPIAFKRGIKRMATGLNPRNNFELNPSSSGDIYYVTIRNFKNGHVFLDEKCDMITQEAWEIIQERSDLHKGDILFARISEEGNVYVLDEEPTNWNINESVFCIRVNKDWFTPEFFAYMVTNQMYYSYLRSDATGTTFLSIKQNKLRESILLAPPIQEQHAIVAYLDSKCAAIDEAIDRHRKIIEKLWEYRKSKIARLVTFKDAHDVYQTDNTWFSSLPKGVSLSCIGKHFDVTLGKMLCSQPRDIDDTLEPYYCAGDVHFDGINYTDLKQMWFSPYEKEAYEIRNGDLLIVEGGAGAGNAFIVSGQKSPTYIQNSILRIRGKKSGSIRYLRYLIEHLVTNGYISFACNTATFSHFTKEKVLDTPFPVADIENQEAIADKIESIDSIVNECKQQHEQVVTKLEEYRKSIIYNAVTGKIDCREAVK